MIAEHLHHASTFCARDLDLQTTKRKRRIPMLIRMFILLFLSAPIIASCATAENCNASGTVTQTTTCTINGCTEETRTMGTFGCDINFDAGFPNPDAANFEFDLAGSTVAVPAAGQFSVTTRNSSGGTIASSTFGWTRSGNIIVPDNPSAVNTWMIANTTGAANTEIELDSGVLGTQPGPNMYFLTARNGATVLGATAQVWTESSPCGGSPQWSDPENCL